MTTINPRRPQPQKLEIPSPQPAHNPPSRLRNPRKWRKPRKTRKRPMPGWNRRQTGDHSGDHSGGQGDTTPLSLSSEHASMPMLRFTPYAWAKLHYLCHHGETEIGGFGLSSAEDLLLIEDVLLVSQTTSAASVSFDDEAVADLFDEQVDAGVAPSRFARVWLHTHPGESAEPSGTDEETFERVFGACDWALMFILARGGQTYARLRFNIGPGGETHLSVCVDYDQPFTGTDHHEWAQAYERCVHAVDIGPTGLESMLLDGFEGLEELERLGAFGELEEFEQLDEFDAMDARDELDERDAMDALEGFDRPIEAAGDLDDLDAIAYGDPDERDHDHHHNYDHDQEHADE